MNAQDERGDLLRLDYGQTTDLLRGLTDARFKLLAFVPTISGATVALFATPRPAIELLAVGLLGLFATLGILVYELRNTLLINYATARATRIEAELRAPSFFGAPTVGGLFGERPGSGGRVLGMMTLTHDGGLALVYGAAFAGWSYLVAWGALRALEIDGARRIGITIGAVAGALIALAITRLDTRSGTEPPDPAGSRDPPEPERADPGGDVPAG